MNCEKWREIPEFKGFYEVSNCGNVRSVSRVVKNKNCFQTLKGRTKKPSMSTSGYLKVCLYKDNKNHNRYVHRLVASAFLEQEKKETVNHIDGNKLNNHVSNLEWATYKENNNHAYLTGLNDEKHRRNKKGSIKVAQYDLDMNLIEEFPSMREAERKTGIDARSISVGVRKGWKYGGFVWKKIQGS